MDGDSEILRGLPDRLRRIMAERTWTQETMAAQCGISKRALENYLSGSKPNYDSIASICAGAEVSADWLLFGTDRGIDPDLAEEAVNRAAFTEFYHFIGQIEVMLEEGAGRPRIQTLIERKRAEVASYRAQTVVKRFLNFIRHGRVENHPWPSDSEPPDRSA